MIMADQLSSNRAADQDCHGVDTKQNSVSDTDLLDLADLCQTGRKNAEDGTGAKTEENRKRDNATGARDGQPDSEQEDRGYQAAANKHGEAAYFVCKVVRDCTPKC